MQPLVTGSVKEWRHRRMLSQQELADRAGTSLFTIQRIERGEGNVRPKTGRAVAAALGVPLEELLPKAQAPLWSDEPSAERRKLDYHACRKALESYCEHWESRIAANNLDDESIEMFFVTAKYWTPILEELMVAELDDMAAPTSLELHNEMLRKTELWPACVQFISLGVSLAITREQKFGKPASTQTSVIYLQEFRDRVARERLSGMHKQAAG